MLYCTPQAYCCTYRTIHYYIRYCYTIRAAHILCRTILPLSHTILYCTPTTLLCTSVLRYCSLRSLIGANSRSAQNAWGVFPNSAQGSAGSPKTRGRSLRNRILAPRWPKLAPRWPQDGPTSRPIVKHIQHKMCTTIGRFC